MDGYERSDGLVLVDGWVRGVRWIGVSAYRNRIGVVTHYNAVGHLAHQSADSY